MAEKKVEAKMEKAQDFELSAEETAKRQQLESKHGRACYLIKAAGLAVWFTEPTVPDIDCWMSEVGDDKRTLSGTVDLLRRNFAEPDGEATIAKRPAVIVAMTNAYQKAIGLGADALLGK